MRAPLEECLESIYETMKSAKYDFEVGTQYVSESLQGIHERLERVEKWIENEIKVLKEP